MKYKFIVVIFLVFYTCSLQAGFGKMIAEILESVAKNSTKHIDDVSPNILPKDINVIQTSKIIMKQLSHYEKNSVEHKVISIIANDLEACNSYNTNKYINFIKSFVHEKSPIRDVLQSKNYLDYYQRYKINCQISEINFLGTGDSIDGISKFAYLEISGKSSIYGLINMTFKKITTFKYDGMYWKIWDEVIIEENLKILEQNWWFYHKDKSMCELLDKDDLLQPFILLENENFQEFNCSTEGLVKKKQLIVSCKVGQLNGSNFVYFLTKNECKDFEKLIKNQKNP